MPNNYFSCAKDREFIEAGGFFCETCLVGKPLDDISPDPRYCQGCHDQLQADKKDQTQQKISRDFWTADGQTFVTSGIGFCVAKDGVTVSIGKVDDLGKPYSATETAENKEITVSKLPTEENLLPKPLPSVNEVVLKHGGGRPRKALEVAGRVTKWRREKEKQAVLL